MSIICAIYYILCSNEKSLFQLHEMKFPSVDFVSPVNVVPTCITSRSSTVHCSADSLHGYSNRETLENAIICWQNGKSFGNEMEMMV